MSAQRLLLVGLYSFCLLGCGSGRMATYPVHGSVRVNGEPAAGVNVYFHPLDGSEQFGRQRPYAETDREGRFRLKTFVRDDGAPAGKYRVTFTWWDQGAESAPVEGNDPERRPRRTVEDKLGGQYANVDESPFEVEITSGNNELKPFELRAQP